eukprot:m51a1_g742 hypothetical protein (224) ;mRNA; f:502180-504258
MARPTLRTCRRTAGTALAMGMHPRLGSESPLALLPQWLAAAVVTTAYSQPDPVLVDPLLPGVPYRLGDWLVTVDPSQEALYVASARCDAKFRFKPVSNGWFDCETAPGAWHTIWSSRYDDEGPLERAPEGSLQRAALAWDEAVHLAEGSAWEMQSVRLQALEASLVVRMAGFAETIEFAAAGGRVTFVGDATRCRATNEARVVLVLLNAGDVLCALQRLGTCT